MITKLKKIQYNSPVILTFTFLALASYLLGYLTNDTLTSFLFSNYRTSFLDPLQYVRLFSYILGHANWAHFSGNFIIILITGPMLEEKYGSKVLVRLILVTAFVTGIIHIIFSGNALLGASGIVYMFIILSSFTNAEKGKIPLTLIIVFFVFVGREIYGGAFSQDNISQFAHIIGGSFGALFAFKIKH
ncbi:rhomboid family intramembrane serine protease [Clostridium tagluense]|uniref:rhomboid family intramembrane serine protease n=1 Tax=Clostridium tagluense TaxID=360422 RepID=UPI001CF1E580|nr:rhomboid family intramembrane serine protease [Clostridium tagluense]MCB2313083.1 rhomboid family intramembrane serine protease [Clostridium tagluense]MCB2317808.1 rhomboid family intramembrane serine protease [Clostridium tagluense]MCB2322592.1 rhomboid family intramembrane serine protease [Clostridium tagluense]MCB2327632.1 rhomboid family intramembrane serine protease [Clostridium tagluense]MCB2332237.1 rhomboid family intramembrane serine protease [Clostridium tagluense]